MLFDTPFVTLPVNDRGRDFCIGDLHGCRGMLDRLLEAVEFDRQCDRLLSVGDLIHRGPESAACLRLAEEPWFFPVMGNHEAMQIAAYTGACWIEDSTLETGLEYLADADPKAIAGAHQRLQDVLARLPLAIETTLADGRRVGVIHAGLRPPYRWTDVRGMYRRDAELDLPRRTLQPLLLWDRWASEAAFAALSAEGEAGIARLDIDLRWRHWACSRPILDIDLLISGHTQTPLAVPLKAGMRLFLDTGAGFPDGWLSMVEVASGRCWQIPDPRQSPEPVRQLKTVPQAPEDLEWLSTGELARLEKDQGRAWLR